MTIVVTVSKDFGLLFHQRRQSQDRLQRANLKALIGNCPLYMNAYSYSLYQDFFKESSVVAEDFLDLCPKDGWALIEDQSIQKYISKIDQVIVYQWNRSYPSDTWLDISLDSFQLVEQVDFVGSSHERITRLTYQRR